METSELTHIDWINPDDLVIANNRNDPDYQIISNDVQKNGVKSIRLLRKFIHSPKHPSQHGWYYFRYTIGNKPTWYMLSDNKSIKGIYYTHIYPLIDIEITELNILYKLLNREDNLNNLLNDNSY